VPPPVRTGYFTLDESAERGAFWLVVSALEPYKRVDLAMAAARRAGADLGVAGDGSQRAALERVSFERVRFEGRASDEALLRLYQTAALMVMPQVEDFGIAAVEAQACGLPVVARRAGGALDIVVEGKTGAFFDEPTPEAIAAAAAEAPRRCAAACRENALRFSGEAFDRAMLAQIREMLGGAVRSSPAK
jgi:glycosyltransferase involved in cell wall biosynthesis